MYSDCPKESVPLGGSLEQDSQDNENTILLLHQQLYNPYYAYNPMLYYKCPLTGGITPT